MRLDLKVEMTDGERGRKIGKMEKRVLGEEGRKCGIKEVKRWCVV